MNSIKKTFSVVIIAIIIFLFEKYISKNDTNLENKIEKNTSSKINVTVSKIKNKSITPILDVYGKIESQKKINILSEVSGKILPQKKEFKVGNFFYKGDVILAVDTTDFSLEIMAYKSDFLSAINQILPFIKMDYNENYMSWEKYVKEFDINKKLKELPTEINSKERNFLASKQVYKLFFSIKSMEKKLEKFILKAPFNGVVSQAFVNTNSVIVPGMQIGEFISSEKFTFSSNIDLSQSNLLNIGNEILLFSNEIDENFTARVSRIAKNIDPLTQKISFYVDFNNSKLYDGMYLSGKLKLNEIDQALEINRELLKNNTILTVDENLKTMYLEVDPVVFINNTVIIKGYNTNNYLVNQSSFNLKEGIKVTPIFE